MSVFALKIIAVLSMVTDHIGMVLNLAAHKGGPSVQLMRAFGRIAFPLYSFLIVNGFEKSSDRKRYISRLVLFAVISQIPFSLACSFNNYLPAEGRGLLSAVSVNPEFLRLLPLSLFSAGVWLLVVCRRKAELSFFTVLLALLLPLIDVKLWGYSLLNQRLNVFYTLAVSLAVISLAELIITSAGKESRFRLFLLSLAALCAALCILPRSDYGFDGLLLISLLYLSRRSRPLQALAMGAWLLYKYSYSALYLIFALAACVPVLLYNGRLGKKARSIFYIIYPLHLIILFLAGHLLN